MVATLAWPRVACTRWPCEDLVPARLGAYVRRWERWARSGLAGCVGDAQAPSNARLRFSTGRWGQAGGSCKSRQRRTRDDQPPRPDAYLGRRHSRGHWCEKLRFLPFRDGEVTEKNRQGGAYGLVGCGCDGFGPRGRKAEYLHRLPPGHKPDCRKLQFLVSIFSSKDEPEDGGWGFLSRWGSFRAF